MELSIPVKCVNPQYIFFAEKRKNIIVDGNFIKITYSTSDFEMNGLHIHFELDTLPVGGISAAPKNWAQVLHKSSPQSKFVDFASENRRSINFSLNTAKNIELIDRLCIIEKEIVDRYIACHCPSKMASYILKNQLLSGVIKYNSDNTPLATQSSLYKTAKQISTESAKEHCILKISGVWETTTNVGITMKFILLC